MCSFISYWLVLWLWSFKISCMELFMIGFIIFFHTVPIASMYVIFTYMNGWFVWFSCRKYQTRPMDPQPESQQRPPGFSIGGVCTQVVQNLGWQAWHPIRGGQNLGNRRPGGWGLLPWRVWFDNCLNMCFFATSMQMWLFVGYVFTV